MPVWLTTIFSVVIILGIFAWIGLSIYQKLDKLKVRKKIRKKLKIRRIKNNVRYVFNNSG
ncbi:Plectrovirus spv1-c74 ORF 12 transmembrane protein [Spiroplasma poulsonii]|nr:Plectrovirus spv1-c74 ORF 12 transmembrane protein [Spiroplasma poulsonii]